MSETTTVNDQFKPAFLQAANKGTKSFKFAGYNPNDANDTRWLSNKGTKHNFSEKWIQKMDEDGNIIWNETDGTMSFKNNVVKDVW
jgi:hypothetical protein